MSGVPTMGHLAREAALLRERIPLGDPALRRSFLERVPENARTLARARELLGEPAASA